MPLLFYAGMDREEYRRFMPYSQEYVKNVLYTYYDFTEHQGKEKYFIEAMDQIGMWQPDARIFLDSGAYSAYTNNVPLSLDDYAQFLEKYEDQFFICASMDDKSDQRATYDNYLALRKAGYTVAPVWHALGGDVGTLREYMSDPDVPMVCIGAIAKDTISDKVTYQKLDTVFHYVGQYNKPVHAFGRTEPELLVKYPFTTADSITWYNARYGLVLKWNPLDRTLRNIKMRRPADMARAFGPRAKVLLGQVPEHYPRPDYHYQVEECLRQTSFEERDLEAYWQKRGVVWEYDQIDRSWKKSCPSDVRIRCQAARAAAGVILPGDDGYVPGMYAEYLQKKRNYRPKRKWEQRSSKHGVVLQQNTEEFA